MFASGHILMLVKISRDSNDVNNTPENTENFPPDNKKDTIKN